MAVTSKNHALVRASPIPAAKMQLSGMTHDESTEIAHKGPVKARIIGFIPMVTTPATAGNLELVMTAQNNVTDTVTIQTRISCASGGGAGNIANCVADVVLLFADS